MPPGITKIDYKRELRGLYAPGHEPVIVEVPEFSYLMVDGHGDPNTAAEFSEAIEALYSVAYGAKFAVKRGSAGIDYSVMPLEGLFWAPDVSVFATADKASWEWTLMIMQPDCVTHEIVEEAHATAELKKSLNTIARVRVERFAEGRAAQIMHIRSLCSRGPYYPTAACFHCRARLPACWQASRDLSQRPEALRSRSE
jgi:hypothetical protein